MPKNDNCLENGPEKRDLLQAPQGGKVRSLLKLTKIASNFQWHTHKHDQKTSYSTLVYWLLARPGLALLAIVHT